MELYGYVCFLLCLSVNPSSGLFGGREWAEQFSEAGKAAGDLVSGAGEAVGNAADAAGEFVSGIDLNKHIDNAKDLASQAGDAVSNIDVGDMIDKAKGAAETVGDLAGKAGGFFTMDAQERNDYLKNIADSFDFESTLNSAVAGMKAELQRVLPNTGASDCVPAEMANYDEGSQKTSICSSANTIIHCLDKIPNGRQYEFAIKDQFESPRFECQIADPANAATAVTPRAAAAAAVSVVVAAVVKLLQF